MEEQKRVEFIESYIKGVNGSADYQWHDNHGELIRCMDCKYRYVDGDNVRFNMCLLNHNKVQPDDWFCADGERKDK